MGEEKKEEMQMCGEECSGREENTLLWAKAQRQQEHHAPEQEEGALSLQTLQSEHHREDQMMSEMMESRLGGGIKET